MIPIHATYIHPSAAERVNEVLRTTFLSEGEMVRQFEKKLEDDLGFRNCVALNSGTSALHLALVLAGIEEGDEVILPAQTFVATGLVILQQKAIPVFADIDYNTGNISVASIRKKITPRTKALMVVHWGGYPCDLDEIHSLARDHKITVIEDAAHALGATYRQKPIGTLSEYTCFSFQAIKHLTTGDGGALCTPVGKYEEAIAKRWFGIERKKSLVTELGERKYDLKELGYKYHLNNYAAALGLANLVDFGERMRRRREVAGFYSKELRNVDGIDLFHHQDDRQSAHWLFGFHVQRRSAFIQAMKVKMISASVVHQRIDRNHIFGGITQDLINQAKFDETQINIPIHDDIDLEKASYIVKAIKDGW